MPTVFWKSSLELENGKDLVTLRTFHGYLTSGMQKVQFTRFSTATGIGNIDDVRYKRYINELSEHVDFEKNSSCESALTEELIKNPEEDSIDIITDARHSTRKNSKYTDVVCVGYNSKKVIENKVVNRTDDPCAQRHELIGTKSIYRSFDGKKLKVRRHVHDRNASINKFVREKQIQTINQNDTWHVSVSIKKQMKNISSGAKCRHNKTWSNQLYDKVGSVKTHVHYAMRNCDGDKDKLRSMLENIVPHYENIHTHCLPNSRCMKDKNYKPSRVIITDTFAKSILLSTIKRFDVYKMAQN